MSKMSILIWITTKVMSVHAEDTSEEPSSSHLGISHHLNYSNGNNLTTTEICCSFFHFASNLQSFRRDILHIL